MKQSSFIKSDFVRKGVLVFASLSLGLVHLASEAAVALKNGNYHVSYKDAIYPGGFDLKLERTYNSKTAFYGQYGHGWGTEFETFLQVSADGSVVVFEYGGGAENRFTAGPMNAAEIQAAANQITEAAKSSGKVSGSAQIKEYQERLIRDATFRNDQWQLMLSLKKAMPRNLPVGTLLTSTQYSPQSVVKTQEGYQRKFESGKVETFDNAGRLRKITDRNGNFIQIEYKDRKISKIQDNLNRKLLFAHNNLGLVSRIDAEGARFAEYKYNNKGELIRSRDTDGNVYEYSYDSFAGATPNRHLLSEIKYKDGTKQLIAYFGRDKYENVKSVVKMERFKEGDNWVLRPGIKSEYDFEYNLGGDPKKFRVSVSLSDDKTLLRKTVYDYENKVRNDGVEWTYRMVESSGDLKTDTVYHERTGLPLEIRRNGKLTAFKYNDHGQVTEKDTGTEKTVLSYAQGKVKRVDRSTKGEKPTSEWVEYSYDARGNVELAKNNAGKAIRMVYDTKGRLVSAVDQARKRVDFTYDVNNRPVKICDPSQGCITVSYNNAGEVKGVDEGKNSRQIAQQVQSTFVTLRDLMEPSGVEFSFF